MITVEMIKEATDFIQKHWGDEVILACHSAMPLNMNHKEFLSHCTACGGNWGGMLLSGINELRPEVYNAIPDNMGVFSWACLCYTLLLLGVDTSED